MCWKVNIARDHQVLIEPTMGDVVQPDGLLRPAVDLKSLDYTGTAVTGDQRRILKLQVVDQLSV